MMSYYRLSSLAITYVDGATSTLSSTIVYHVEPDCKGQYANLAGWHQKMQQQNIPNPAGMRDAIDIM